MQRTKTLAYDSKVPAPTSERPDSVAPASGIRLVRPPLATLPGASTVPPPPSARPMARTLPLVVAPVPPSSSPEPTAAAPSTRVVAKALPFPTGPKTASSPRPMFGSSRALVPPPPPSGPRARTSSAPPPSKRPPRPEPQLLDDDLLVADDAETVAYDLTQDAVPVPERPKSTPPKKLPSLRATGQNWPLVQWPRLEVVTTPKPATARASAPPRPGGAPPVALVALPDLGGTQHGPEAPEEVTVVSASEGERALSHVSEDACVDVAAAPVLARPTQMIPPPPSSEADVLAPADVATDAPGLVVYDDDAIDIIPLTPLARLRAAAGQVRPILAWLDQNPRAFASVGFGAGVVVALFVALVVQ